MAPYANSFESSLDKFTTPPMTPEADARYRHQHRNTPYYYAPITYTLVELDHMVDNNMMTSGNRSEEFDEWERLATIITTHTDQRFHDLANMRSRRQRAPAAALARRQHNANTSMDRPRSPPQIPRAPAPGYVQWQYNDEARPRSRIGVFYGPEFSVHM